MNVRIHVPFPSRFQVVGALLALAAAVAPLAGADATPGAVAGPEFPYQHSTLAPDPAVTWGHLANGLRWCVMPNAQPAAKVSLRLRVDHGSLDEDEAQRGLAHYLEHMAFNGSAHYPPGRLVDLLESLGLAFGADSNAHTAQDETVFKLDLPDAKPETLATGLSVMADFAGTLLIRPQETDKERGVILAEMRDRNTPGYREWEALSRAEFPGTRIGERLPIGLESTVKAADAGLLRAYYDTWYRPEAMTLAVVGDLDPKAAAAAVATAFSALTARAPARAPTALGALTVGTGAAGIDVLCHHEGEDDSTSAELICVRERARPHDDADRRRAETIEDLAERVLSHRIADLVEGDPQCPVLGGEAYSYQWLGYRIAGISVHARPGQDLAAVAMMERERRRMIAFGPTAAELAVAADAERQAFDQAVGQAATRTDRDLATGLYTSIAHDEVFMTPTAERELGLPVIAAATAEDVRAAFAERWDEHDRHLLIAVYGREARESEAAVRAAFDQAAAARPEAPVERKVAPWAYGDVRDTGTVMDDTTVAPGVRELRFANHIRASIRRSTAQPNQVLVVLRISVPAAGRQPGLSDLCGACFLDGGLGRHTARDLRELFAGSSIQVQGPTFSEDAAQFSLQCLPADLEGGLQYLRAFITDPGWRPEAAERAKTAWIEQLSALDSDLDARVSREFTRLAVGNAPQRRPVGLDEAKAVTLHDVVPWFRDLLQAAPMQVSIAGDVDPDHATELARHYIGSLGEHRDIAFMPDAKARDGLAVAAPFPAGEHRLAVPGTNPRAVVMVGWPTDDGYDIAQVRRLRMLSQAFTEMLRLRLREKGKAYSPYASISASEAYRGDGCLVAHAGVAPDGADGARDTMFAIAADLARDGVDPAIFTQVKEPAVRGLVAYRQKNEYWLGSVLARCQEQPFRLEWANGMEADYAAISAADLNALAKKYFVPERALVVIGVCAGDGGSATAPAPAPAAETTDSGTQPEKLTYGGMVVKDGNIVLIDFHDSYEGDGWICGTVVKSSQGAMTISVPKGKKTEYTIVVDDKTVVHVHAKIADDGLKAAAEFPPGQRVCVAFRKGTLSADSIVDQGYKTIMSMNGYGTSASTNGPSMPVGDETVPTH
jgi:zinc protease